MDDNIQKLLTRTIGLIETLPERIERIEEQLRDLELDFTDHKASQNTYCSAAKDCVEKDLKAIKEEVALLEEICKSLKRAGHVTNNRLESLEGDYTDRKTKESERLKEIKTYKTEAGKKIISVLAVILVLFIAVSVGVPTEYLPWYQPNQQTIETEEAQTLISISLQQDGSINESDLIDIVKKHPRGFSYSYDTKKSLYYFVTKNYIQLINKDRYSGSQIRVNRGK
jgi:lipopolysaccharide export LptBFGC system permease protein LptF